jgi:hypothetical protein
MNGETSRAIPYRLLPHLYAAFGGPFGMLNLLVGAMSICRRIALTSDIQLSLFLDVLFQKYVAVFHRGNTVTAYLFPSC